VGRGSRGATGNTGCEDVLTALPRGRRREVRLYRGVSERMEWQQYLVGVRVSLCSFRRCLPMQHSQCLEVSSTTQ
jgi:hypothetical protein